MTTNTAYESNIDLADLRDLAKAFTYILASIQKSEIDKLANLSSFFASFLLLLLSIEEMYNATQSKRGQKSKFARGAVMAGISIPALASSTVTILASLGFISASMGAPLITVLAGTAASWALVVKSLHEFVQVSRKTDPVYLIQDRLIKHHNLQGKIEKLKQKTPVDEKKVKEYEQSQRVLLNQAQALFKVEKNIVKNSKTMDQNDLQRRLEEHFNKKVYTKEKSSVNIQAYLEEKGVNLETSSSQRDKTLYTHLITKQHNKLRKKFGKVSLAGITAIGVTALALSVFAAPVIAPLFLVAGIAAIAIAGTAGSAYLINKIFIRPFKAKVYREMELAEAQKQDPQKSMSNIDNKLIAEHFNKDPNDMGKISEEISTKDRNEIIQHKAAEKISFFKAVSVKATTTAKAISGNSSSQSSSPSSGKSRP